MKDSRRLYESGQCVDVYTILEHTQLLNEFCKEHDYRISIRLDLKSLEVMPCCYSGRDRLPLNAVGRYVYKTINLAPYVKDDILERQLFNILMQDKLLTLIYSKEVSVLAVYVLANRQFKEAVNLTTFMKVIEKVKEVNEERLSLDWGIAA